MRVHEHWTWSHKSFRFDDRQQCQEEVQVKSKLKIQIEHFALFVE